MSLQIAAQSIEYIRVPIEAFEQGSKVDPTATTVQFAFLTSAAATPVSGDWKAGSWEQANRDFFARALVGAAPGVFTMTAGVTYYVWVRITNTPEVPVKYAGTILAV